jgi:hypothetical protein
LLELRSLKVAIGTRFRPYLGLAGRGTRRQRATGGSGFGLGTEGWGGVDWAAKTEKISVRPNR